MCEQKGACSNFIFFFPFVTDVYRCSQFRQLMRGTQKEVLKIFLAQQATYERGWTIGLPVTQPVCPEIVLWEGIGRSGRFTWAAFTVSMLPHQVYTKREITLFFHFGTTATMS